MKTEKNRTAKKLYEWMWFIITLAPFIICLFTAFNDSFIQMSLEDALNAYFDFISLSFRGSSGQSFVVDLLYNILSKTNDLGDPLFSLSSLAVLFGVHLISVEIVRIVVDLLLWVPRFLQKQLNKGVK